MKLPLLFAALLALFSAACGTDPVQSDQSPLDPDGPGMSDGSTDCSDYAGTVACGGFCVFLATERQHCGECGNACQVGEMCVNGACAAATCGDTQTDPANCGACGNSCSGGTCVGGMCQCTGGGLSCGGACVPPNDPMNCGTCGNSCPAGTGCVNGACTCSPGFSACGTACVDTSSDGANCGTCGTNCATQGLLCAAGACTATCPAGTAPCGGGCVDVQTSVTNCGACGVICGAGQTCAAGACACGVGQTMCSGSCVDVATNAANCGACGTACAAGQQCVAGACSGGTPPPACPVGQEACSGVCVPAGSCSGAGGAPVGVGGGPGQPGNGGTVGVGGAGPNPTPSGENPPGYWTSGNWHGCAWTGVDTLGVGTEITPADFLSLPPGDPYCVSGVVGAHAEYESVALLGFNINEPNTVTCEYEEVTDATPPAPTGMTEASGIAVNFVKQGGDTAFTWRVQIQGPEGHLDGEAGAADRWCATITEVQGKVFIPYTDFNTACWDGSGDDYAGEPITAVSFLVPGSPDETPFDFCVNGFAYGTSAADAPDGSAMAGDQTGTVGSTVTDAENSGDFDRAKVLVGDEQYIIQNNNWGNPGGSDCILDYVNNSFVVSTCTGSNNPAPAAFPSIYIGNNGNTAQGVNSTSTTDSLPKQISAITSLNSTFRYSGGGGGSYNATYDIWFANTPPTTEYQDGIDGFIMIWLYDPTGAQPIGTNMGSATIAGQTWNYWVGPRGDGPSGYNDAPVISYVNPTENDNSRAQSFVDKNIKEFFDHAVGLNQGISESMYLTDVFAGFEIWNGGQGLTVDEFTAVVAP
jgi:hypothetical protein